MEGKTKKQITQGNCRKSVPEINTPGRWEQTSPGAGEEGGATSASRTDTGAEPAPNTREACALADTPAPLPGVPVPHSGSCAHAAGAGRPPRTRPTRPLRTRTPRPYV